MVMRSLESSTPARIAGNRPAGRGAANGGRGGARRAAR